MKTAHELEKEDQMRVNKRLQYIEHCKTEESTLRFALREAQERTKRAREKYAQVFSECENRAVKRRKDGQIDNRLD